MILGFAMLRLPLVATEQSSCIANRVLLEDLGLRVCRAASERPTLRKSLATQSMIIAAVITWGSSVCEGRQPTGSNVSPGIQHSSRDQVLCVMAYGLHCIISKKNYLQVNSLPGKRFASKVMVREEEADPSSYESDRWLHSGFWLQMITKSSERAFAR